MGMGMPIGMPPPGKPIMYGIIIGGPDPPDVPPPPSALGGGAACHWVHVWVGSHELLEELLIPRDHGLHQGVLVVVLCRRSIV